MNQRLDALICERHPEIFVERTLSPEESCMGRGIECGDGWFAVLDKLCRSLQWETTINGAPQITAMQVKQKFGFLAFRVKSANQYQSGMIHMASVMSSLICEQCGAFGQLVVTPREERMTRCREHMPRGSRVMLDDHEA